jgi:hypothetical protein
MKKEQAVSPLYSEKPRTCDTLLLRNGKSIANENSFLPFYGMPSGETRIKYTKSIDWFLQNQIENTKPRWGLDKISRKTPNPGGVWAKSAGKHQTPVGFGQNQSKNTKPRWGSGKISWKTPNPAGVWTKSVGKHQPPVGFGQNQSENNKPKIWFIINHYKF